MAGFDSSPHSDMATASRKGMPEMPGMPDSQAQSDVTPPVGITPPAVLVEQAAEGRRGAAWRLLQRIIENDPRAVLAVTSLDDDRLAHYLLECIALGTWAGHPFVLPPALRSAYARTRLRTLFLPETGMNTARAERVLMAAVRDRRPAMREQALYLLGLIHAHLALPAMIEALNDPVPGVRLQAAKALGRMGDPQAVPALLTALQTADEQMGSQIFQALVRLGRAAVPALLAGCHSHIAWTRWQCVRALGEIGDDRAIPILAEALTDIDHSVAWMSAKSLVRCGRPAVLPVLRVLVSAEVSPWLVETASYILRESYRQDPRYKPYLEPVVQSMHGPAFRIATPQAARAALAQLSSADLLTGV